MEIYRKLTLLVRQGKNLLTNLRKKEAGRQDDAESWNQREEIRNGGPTVSYATKRARLKVDHWAVVTVDTVDFSNGCFFCIYKMHM